MNPVRWRVILSAVVVLGFASVVHGQQPAPRAEPKLELVVQTGHGGPITSVSISKDGSRVLTGSRDQTAILWDAATGHQLRTFAGHTAGVTAVAMSRDGTAALTGSDDGHVIVWDTRTGNALRKIVGVGGVRCLALAANDKTVVVGRYGAVELWDAISGRKGATLDQDVGGLVAVSGAGPVVLADDTASGSKIANAWDVAAGKKLRTFDGGHKYALGGVAVSASGKLAIAGSLDKSAVVWNMTTGERLQTLTSESFVKCVAVSDNDQLAALGSGFSAILYNVATGKQVYKFDGHTSLIEGLTFSSDGGRLLTGSSDKTAILWDTNTGRKLRTFAPHVAPGRRVTVSEDGQTVMTVSPNEVPVTSATTEAAVNVWNLGTGQRVYSRRVHKGSFNDASLSKDGRVVLNGVSESDAAALWDLGAERQLAQLKPARFERIHRCELSRDGKLALTALTNATAILWDTSTGQRLKTIGQPIDGTRDHEIAMDADGNTALLALGRTATLWDLASAKTIRTFAHSEDEVGLGITSVALRHDRKHIAIGSDYALVFVWDTFTGTKLLTLSGHAGEIRSVTFARDGKTLVTGSKDKSAIVWDFATGEKRRTFTGHLSGIESVEIASDGRYLWSASRDGTTRLWDIATGKELCSLISIDAGKDWLVVTPEGLFDGSPDATRFLSYRISGTLDFVPLERYQQKYWRPGLLAQIMRGEKPEPTVNINKTLPPKVRFADAIKPGMELKRNTLTVEAIAETRSNFPIKAFRLLVDGRPYRGQIGVQKLAEPKVGESRAKWDIELEPGRHTLKVMVDTEYVQGASDEIEVKYVGGGAGAVELPALHILAVGISDYPDATRKLDFAHLDAQAVADAFRAHSKTLFKEIDAKVITNKDANRRGIFAGMQWLREKMAAKPNSVGVMFFAGHGEKDKGDGMLYLLPHDFEEKNYGASAIEATTFKNQLASIPGRLMLILDACHSGETGKEKTRSSGELTDQLIRDLTAEEHGLIVFASALGHQKAQESREFKHGMFTQAMIEALSGKAPKSADGAVYLDSMIGYVGNRVRDLTKGYQSPVPGRPIAIRDFPISKP